MGAGETLGEQPGGERGGRVVVRAPAKVKGNKSQSWKEAAPTVSSSGIDMRAMLPPPAWAPIHDSCLSDSSGMSECRLN